MKVLVLGAGGCFGNNFAAYCLKRGYDVVGIGRSPRKPECFSLGIDYPYYAYHITYELDYVVKRIRAYAPDYIVNFAAQGESAACWEEDNWRFYETNCVGLVHLVGKLNETRNFRKFIHVSTSELYGSREFPAKETEPITPTSPYGVSKAAFDLHLKVMHERLDFPMNIIRPSNCIVEGQQLHRIIPKTFLTILKKEKLSLFGGGKARKTYLHAEDLSQGIVKLFDAPMGEIYNCAAELPISIKNLVVMCATVAGVEYKDLVEIGQERTGEDACYWLSSDKIKALGWRQQVTLLQGVERMWGWINKYPELKSYPINYVMRA